MGDLRNKAKKLEEERARQDANDREKNGWTVFYFNFDPRHTRRNMTVGEAIRYLLRRTGTRISWWRCDVRGLAIQYHRKPQSSYLYDKGETYTSLVFSPLDDEVAAKKELAIDMLLRGLDHYRGLPNRVFDREVTAICWLLNAPPSVPAQEWLTVKKRLQKQTQSLLETHEAELRKHLLGKRISGAKDFHILRENRRKEI